MIIMQRMAALTETIGHFAYSNYDYGKVDCVAFVAFYIRMVTGKAPAKVAYRHKLSDAELLGMVSNALGGASEGEPQPYDVVAWNGEEGAGIGVLACYDGVVWTMHEIGVSRVKPVRFVGHWKVGE